MKKRIVFALLAVSTLLSLVACSEPAKVTETEEPKVTTEEKLETKTEVKTEEKVDDNKKDEAAVDAASIMNKIWDKFPEDKKFAAMGGAAEAPVDGKAGSIDLKNVESVTASLHITEDALGKVLDAASLTHMMNANSFTGAVYHVKAEDAAALTESLNDSIKGTRWMCGFPDTLLIYTVDSEYVIAVFGNTENIDTFKNAVKDSYGDQAVLKVEESLA